MMIRLLLFPLLLSLLGCSTYHLKIRKTLNLVDQKQYERAAESVKPLAFQPGGDQLAYLLEYATIQQLAGNYEESNKAFQLADEISEVKDYISLSDQVASIVFSESMVAYQGDDYEKILINMFSAMNYAAMENYESALVEIRRLNNKLNAYRTESGRDYDENPFAYYLAGIMWEQEKKWDDSCIDYKKYYELGGRGSNIEDDLLYCSYKSRRSSDLNKYKKEFAVQSYSKKEARQREQKSEILLVVHQGWGPRKVPNPAWHRVPVLRPQINMIRQVKTNLVNLDSPETKYEYITNTGVNLEKISVAALQKQYAGLMAKRIAARIAKQKLAREIGRDNENLGILAKVVMDVSDQADLRQWSTLPESLQVSRIFVEPGNYKIDFSARHFDGRDFPIETEEVHLEKDKLKVIILRISG